MAAEPVKSPLHNFPLTFLKWGSKKDQQRCRRPPYDTPLSPSPPPPPPDAEPSNSKGSRSSRNRRNNNHRYPPTPPPPSPSPLPTTTAPGDADGEEEEEERDCGKKPEAAEEGEGEGDDGEKGWNLRPRRAAAMKGIFSTTNINPNTHTPAVIDAAGDNLPKSMRLRGSETQGNGGASGGRGSEMREYKRFWIALSRDEIEEDIYSMTSSKPSRRPKKRPKNVQKQLDNVFPGLWMVGFSPKSYRGGHDELPKI